jgi:hypothetical protein
MPHPEPARAELNREVSDFPPSAIWVYLISESVLLIVLSLCGVRIIWALAISFWGAVFAALIWGVIWAWRDEATRSRGA